MIHSHFNYCLTTWFHGNKVIANKIRNICDKFNKMFRVLQNETKKKLTKLTTASDTKFLTVDQWLIKNRALHHYHRNSLLKVF